MSPVRADQITNIRLPLPEIAEFCDRWSVAEFALFGSVLRDDFRSDSDIDVLVDLDRERHHTLIDLVDMQADLEVIFGRKVDIVTRRGIEHSLNYLRRDSILSSAVLVYRLERAA
ncbi:MAG: nucleotidyltransferase domain-containing protein [Cyanobacteria bacterium P01_A01_bin.114]